jgi:N-methylhydantoinase A/oxoprolinase/acetone carboxylase beta subunit
MELVLGVDTGGTYTDAVVVAPGDARPLASAKALTTPRDLSIGISDAIGRLSEELLAGVHRVCLSTTLATNAVVEGRGARVFLLLLGHDAAVIERFSLARDLEPGSYALVRGRMSQGGEELDALDEGAIRRIAAERLATADAFAISGYFATKNPAHEQRAEALLREITDKPVVCGHELSSQLDCIGRAVTSVMNARLLPIVRSLIAAVQRSLAALGLGEAQLLVMRGDGSLMTVASAHERPIETTLSGPAASAIGARALAGATDAMVIDMGGTTTDLAVLVGGEPMLCEAGALVGGVRTHVRACDLATMGLGGDSHMRLGKGGGLDIGPRRVVPLALLAAEHHELVLDTLARTRLDLRRARSRFATDFAMAGVADDTLCLTSGERELLDALDGVPVDLPGLASRLGVVDASLLPLSRLEERGTVQRCGVTPTDVLHAVGRLAIHDPAASRAGALMLADALGMDLDALHRRMVERIGEELALFALERGLREDLPARLPAELLRELLRASLRGAKASGVARLNAAMGLPLVAIGAPVAEYLPPAAERLSAELCIPPHAEVANAVGAAVGEIRRTVELEVRPVYRGAALSHYAVHSTVEMSEWPTLDEALAYAESLGARLAREGLAGAAGEGGRIAVDVRRITRSAEAQGGDVEVLMAVLVRATARVEDAPLDPRVEEAAG